MSRRVLAITTVLALLVLGVTLALPATSAVTTVAVSIPQGAGDPTGAPGYSPDTITIVIGVNNTVEWTDNDNTAPHTVTSVSVPSGASSFNSGSISKGGTYSYTFTVAGTYDYNCIYHSWMTGTIVVKAASGTPSPEFPTASLAITLFAVVAIAILAAPRLRTSIAPLAAKS